MMKIGILTTFYKWDDAYSLSGVVKHQIFSLSKNGYEPILFVLENFDEKSLNGSGIKDVEIRRVVPQVITEPYQGCARGKNIPSTFDADVEKIVPVFEREFEDINFVFTHDIIFQDSFLAYNAAIHKMTMKNDQWFFHWMHSGPSVRPKDLQPPASYLYSLPPQSTLIYMNAYDVTRAAEMYGIYAKDVRVVRNPIDYRTLPNVHPVVEKIIEASELNEADIVGCYPLSTTRMDIGGKQLRKAIKIMANLKSLGNKVRYIVPNAHANADREKLAIREMLEFGRSLGLEPMKDLIFTSLIDQPVYEHGISHDAVLQLFQISDLFLFPSVSENCPLILLEAALTKNLMVLNEDFSPMKDFVGSDALYFKFDSINTVTTHQDGEDSYYMDVAKIIFAELQSNRIWRSHRQIRQRFNIDNIFKKEIEPLFYEQRKPIGLQLRKVFNG